MISREGILANLMSGLAQGSQSNDEVAELLNDIHEKSVMQQDALRTRFSAIGADAPTAEEFSEVPFPAPEFPVTSALTEAAGALNQAIVGYAMLRSIALRYRDSILAGEDNTGDMAERHLGSYVRMMHRIYRVLNNAVLWELDKDGETCQCTCPSCSHGICMRSQAPRRTLSDIWSEAGPIADDTSVYVHPPRPGSPAEQAGLCAGDEILEADGNALETHFVLQGIVGEHARGDPMELRVRRASGEVEAVSIIKS